MKKISKILATLTIIISIIINPSLTHAQTSNPAVVLSPDKTVTPGSNNNIDISLVNMGIPLKRIEITVRLNGDMDYSKGMSLAIPNTTQYGLEYKSHYFKPYTNRTDIQDFVAVFEATNPQGYNQGSAQIPLIQLTYTVTKGTFAATVIPENTKLTDIDGNLTALYTSGSRNYSTLPKKTIPESDIQTYSLSFESDPIRKWWPTAPNSVQQIDAAIWKDSDEDNVKNFTAIVADWQVDSTYFEITDTSSSYFSTCPTPTVSGRPCIRFAAHVKTKKTGKTSVMLKVTDTKTGRETWNSYPAEIYSVSAQETNQPTISPSLLPISSFIPENQISNEEFKEIQQKVTYLQSQFNEQQTQIVETQNILQKMLNFLKRLFRF
ncbi:hypothetical protein KKD03_04280 [Patescibacteria group bacterium]|nr:hypothetical protein [Patescibacteria group bacterium]